MPCSSHSNTLLAIHMIPFFLKFLPLQGSFLKIMLRGYGYDWKREEADKNLLHTHTTAVSSRLLYLLAQKPSTPKRYFSIDRVFRNEAVDRTHLAEFHQIEGTYPIGLSVIEGLNLVI